MFNEFDTFKLYNRQDIEDNNLYIVKANSFNMFLNKKYNLCYGRFIYNFINDPECSIEIIAYKEPSFVHKVAYENIVPELFQNTNNMLSDSDEENNALKNIIANIQYGLLLEKKVINNLKALCFDTIEDCNHYRMKYGGT